MYVLLWKLFEINFQGCTLCGVHSNRSKSGTENLLHRDQENSNISVCRWWCESVQWTWAVMIACVRRKCNLAVESSKVVSSPANSTFALSAEDVYWCTVAWEWREVIQNPRSFVTTTGRGFKYYEKYIFSA